jgi:Spx/MgsR family transcriptional regulator
MIQVYGIKNCNTVKKSIEWLKQANIEFVFHDFKTEGVTATQLKEWHKKAGWKVLFNKKGTTYRNLSEKEKAVSTAAGALKVMQAHPTVIKRPVIELDNQVIVGFNEAIYKYFFKK